MELKVKSFIFIFSLFITFPLLAGPNEEFLSLAQSIQDSPIEELPVQNNGRLKPFHSLARESILFINGRYQFEHKASAIQTYLALIIYPKSDQVEIINVRNKNIRAQLGSLPGNKKNHFSIKQLDKWGLMGRAAPLLDKEQRNKRSLEPEEKDLLELYNQYQLTKFIISGNHFLAALDFASLQGSQNHGQSPPKTLSLAKEYLRALASQSPNTQELAKQLIESSFNSPMPPLFEKQKKKIKIEVYYNKLRPFFIAALFLLFIGLSFFFKQAHPFYNTLLGKITLSIPLLILFLGFVARVYITGFAPVTNMYGTMIWVSFGVSLFSLILLYLYKSYYAVGSLWIGAGLTLILTENLPLILSPNMDPIVAVLRSNLWLTIHVLTIVISYAAFTITMILSNVALVRSLVRSDFSHSIYKEFSKLIYRMTQLGVFLLSVGIILGGVWADYSWGRFWGWDPKETWALIADIGYLAILHARYIGWLKPFGILLASPLAYLLVIMAWYGVNFILASGLHSYGFSSGGATMVGIFVATQLFLLLLAGANYWKKVKASSH
ncbi:MAG: hypothetical protein D6797_07420 [Bdellovibrio sp.]|nr:MAG: hypothetical protein D6797_07420 [Bdellovibrio sp.]